MNLQSKSVQFIISVILLLSATNSFSQTLMPLPPHNSVYAGSARGYWFVAPCNFTIKGLRVPFEAGSGLQYIHVMKCHTPFPIASGSQSTNFTTLTYISGAPNNVIQNVNIRITAGDTIGIMGTAGTDNSYATGGPSMINGLPVHLTRFGYQGDINTGPAPSYWGSAGGATGSISRVEMYYVLGSASNNASIEDLVSPVNFCGGSQDIKVRLANKGSNAINNVTVQWSLDNIMQPAFYWSGVLDTIGSGNPSDTVITLGNVSFGTAAQTIKVWTEYPNFVADTVNSDDTLNAVLKPALSGTYTIGGTTPDYASINAAVSDLNASGVCGPVTFNIRTGSYTARIGLNNIGGASATNTIIFRSEAGHRDSVIISASGTSTDNYMLKLNNCNYVTVRDLSLVALNATYGRVTDYIGTSSYNTVENCKLEAPATSGEYTVYADDLSGGHNVFRNNLIMNGERGIYFYGHSSIYTDSNLFENNIIQNFTGYGAYFYYTDNLKFRNNKLTGTTAANYGMRTYYSYNGLEITGNSIYLPSGTYGMYMYYNNGTASAGALIANNTIINDGNYGIRNYYGSYQKFYNNSIRVTGSNGAIYVTYNSASYTNNEWKNNIFYNAGTAYAAYINNSGTNNVWNNNLYYTTGGTLISGYTTLAAWQNATGQDKQSWNYRPAFISATDLGINITDSACWKLNGTGVQLPVNAKDINGTPRSITLANGAPDIGAYEFTPAALPPVAVASPATPAAGARQSFLVGQDTIATIDWAAFSTVPPSVTARFYSGEFVPGTLPTDYRTNCYWDISDNGFGGVYSYTVNLYYRDAMKGTVDEQGMILTKRSGANPWTPYYTSSADSVQNILTATNLFDFSLFTGTHLNNPLPVKLTSFDAARSGSVVNVSWSTTSEIQTSHFTVEASVDGKKFIPVGDVKAKGNTASKTAYRFVHRDAQKMMSSSRAIYYRLVAIDRNKASSTSDIIKVSFENKGSAFEGTSIYPNPFSSGLTLGISSAVNTTVTIEVTDIRGSIVASSTEAVTAGSNEISLRNMDKLENGVYFIKASMNGESRAVKAVKY